MVAGGDGAGKRRTQRGGDVCVQVLQRGQLVLVDTWGVIEIVAGDDFLRRGVCETAAAFAAQIPSTTVALFRRRQQGIDLVL